MQCRFTNKTPNNTSLQNLQTFLLFYLGWQAQNDSGNKRAPKHTASLWLESGPRCPKTPALLLRSFKPKYLLLWRLLLKGFLPTPEKCHYLFNLRDIAKIFQGIYLADPKVQSNQAAVLTQCGT